MSNRKYDVFVRITDPSIKPRVVLTPRAGDYTRGAKGMSDIRNLRPDEAAQLGNLLRHAAALALHDADVELAAGEPKEWDAAEPPDYPSEPDESGMGDIGSFIRGVTESYLRDRTRAKEQMAKARGEPTSIDPTAGLAWQHNKATQAQPFSTGIDIVTIEDTVAFRFSHVPGIGPAKFRVTPEVAESLAEKLAQAITNAKYHRTFAGGHDAGAGSPAQPDETPQTTAEPQPDAPAAGDAPTGADDTPPFDDRIPGYRDGDTIPAGIIDRNVAATTGPRRFASRKGKGPI